MCRDILSDRINRRFSNIRKVDSWAVRNVMRKSVQRGFGLETRFEE